MLQTTFLPELQYGKTSLEPSAVTREKTSEPSSKLSRKSATRPPMFLNLQKTNGGGAGAIMGNGWSLAWRTLDAQFWGVPQRRRRIYLIADFGSERAGEILFEQESLRGNSSESRSARQGTSNDAERGAGGSVDLVTESAGAFESYTQDATKAGTLKQTDYKGAQIVCMENGNCLNPWDCQSKRIFTTNGPFPTLPAMAGGGANNQAICFQASGDRDNPSISTSEKAYCIPANPMSDRGQAVCFQQNQREEVRLLGDKTGAIAANGGAHQTNYIMFKERAGKPGGGKGILCSDRPFTLSTLTDQSVCYAAGFKAGNSAQAHGIGWQEEISPTLQAGEGGNQKPTVCYALQTAQANRNGLGAREGQAYTMNCANDQAVCYSVDCRNFNMTEKHGTLQAKENGGHSLNYSGAVCYPVENHPNDSRVKICEDGICPTIPARMGTGGGNGPMVLEQQVYTAGNGQTNTIDKLLPHARTLDCMHDQQILLHKTGKPRKYIVRRLTPLECARLQGFPDCWCSEIETENPTEEEIAFWAEVWETHRIAMEKSGNPKSRNQIIKWLRDPRSDSSEYRMWGNGIALPNAIHVIGCAAKLIKSTQQEAKNNG